ncbi:MAG: heparinase II/III-family protein [Armatimonadetes bacterium]|nr:heparinase II/III-family protein [Armatimonadota bacterium]
MQTGPLAVPGHVVLWALGMLALCLSAPAADLPYSWHSRERGEKVLKLVPGQAARGLTRETLFAEWTAQQIAKWEQTHPAVSAEEAYRTFAATAPTDADLAADFPRLISPYGRVLSGQPDPKQAQQVMVTYCPFCGAWHDYYNRLFFVWDEQNPHHAKTRCCGKNLYERAPDVPAGYDLRYDRRAEFQLLDDTKLTVPAASYQDKQGVVWELYLPNIFAHRRWERTNGLVTSYLKEFKQSGNPLAAHKLAVILDVVADTYYGLPLARDNKLADGKDGKPLTRAEWEAVPRPAIFEYSYLGPWNRRIPTGSVGWLNAYREHLWAEPFARVRHHPAFREVSRHRYGAPEALDSKVRDKLLREVVMMFKSCYAQLLKSNYQEADYTEMMILGLLAGDEYLFDFAAANQECTLYNHHGQDGLNQQGAPNYMAMLSSYYRFMADPAGWLEFGPDFLKRNPFFAFASTELGQLRTVRGLEFEFGDQHQWDPVRIPISTDPAKVAVGEQRPSRSWPGYGVSVLRVGGPGHRQEVVLTHDRISNHSKADKLGIQCWVDGVPVMRAGGYAYDYHGVVMDESRPEIQAFVALPFPTRPVGVKSWSFAYSATPMAQNTVTVNDTGTCPGWSDKEGFGEVITFKGGEAPGEPGAGFQVLDVRDHDSFDRMGVAVKDFRRTLLGVEGEDGRPYVIDLVTLAGGKTHTLYQSAWAVRGEDRLPAVQSREENLAAALFGKEAADARKDYAHYARIRHVERLGPAPEDWDLTWKTDWAAYAPRDPAGKPFVRPFPEDVGRVRLRLLGLRQPGDTELMRAKGPWVPWFKQPLLDGKEIYGYVAFEDANDFLIERRHAAGEGPLDSCFVHVLEGYREGEQSVIGGVERLAVAAGPPTAVALKLDLAGGTSDTVIFQPEAGRLRLADGVETDAPYALLRRSADGEVLEAHTVRGTYLTCGKFALRSAGDLTGTIVDLVGDLTGTRQESALIVKPNNAWAAGEVLRGRQLLVRATNTRRGDSNEGYEIERVTGLPGGLLRVDLAHQVPFATGWHQVTDMGTAGPNTLRTNRTFSAGINTSWVWGLRVWFPRTGHRYTCRRIDPMVGGASGAALLEVAEDVELAAEGIKPGDWFVAYFIEPGQTVSVASSASWRKDNGRG